MKFDYYLFVHKTKTICPKYLKIAHLSENIAIFYVINLQNNRMSSFGFMVQTIFPVKMGVEID